jgi:hypothetical protein
MAAAWLDCVGELAIEIHSRCGADRRSRVGTRSAADDQKVLAAI